jgi:N-acetyl sugar amidotransferase
MHRFDKLLSADAERNLRDAFQARSVAMDAQLRDQPPEVRFCRRCVISNQRPRIVFDGEGVCSACRFADYKREGIDWKAREARLVELLDGHRSGDGRYDVIVPASGGKDSAYVAHQLKTRYGMHPLTVTFAPFIPTDIGFENFYSFVQSGFDNLTCWPGGRLHRKLARLSLDLLGDAWQPFLYGQLNYAFHLAWRFGIRLVFFGENGEAEYGGSGRGNDRPSFDWPDWEALYLKGATVDRMLAKGVELGAISPEEATHATPFYSLPPVQELQSRGIAFHWMGYYHRWVPQENFYYAQQHTGFTPNPDGRSEGTYSKYASLDDCTDGYHYYLGFIKFGIGRATSDAAHEIRDGHLTRTEGVSLVKRYDGEFPRKHYDRFLAYLDIDDAHFQRVVDAYRSPHLWERQDGEWRLRHACWHAEQLEGKDP